jgi:hypothetical protein
MPRIPREVLNCTFNLYPNRQAAEAGEPFGGTGFFVGRKTGRRDLSHFTYAVTNWHVACRDGLSVMRVNDSFGSVRILELDPSEWEFLPRWADIAIAGPTALSPLQDLPLTILSEDMFLTATELHRLEIGPGEDVFMVGRFVDHDGQKENRPTVRFGNISAMLEEVEQPTGSTEKQSIILDMHSRDGYSGSPVFVYRTIGSDLTQTALFVAPDAHFVKLLGVHWGQFPEEWNIRQRRRTSRGEAAIVREDDIVIGMSGMTLAIPAWDIKLVLENSETLVRERQRLLEEMTNEIASGISPVAE